jgi:uncharacterized protein YlxW (UPF0749 family)
MNERLVEILRKRPRIRRPLMILIGATVGFLIVVTAGLRPPDPESRLPGSQRLAALIQRQQEDNERQREDVELLRSDIAGERDRTMSRGADADARRDELNSAGLTAGLVPLRGQGFTVTLDDSSLSESPTGDVNDLVIHSQDVQAVVNGMWSAGAEAISINAQRVVSTSAVLCVGNTLLINGTVHSPPYEIANIGADRSFFMDDALVRQLRGAADRFSLRVSISGGKSVELPGYSGTTESKYAHVVGD